MPENNSIFNWNEFLADLTQAKSREEAKRYFDGLLSKQGLTACLYADVQEPEKLSDSITFLDNFPIGWMERYLEKDYCNHDSALKDCLNSAQPVLWKNYDKQLEKESFSIEKLIREESKSIGLKAGITFPLHHATNTSPATLSLATDGDVEEFYQFIEFNMDSLYLAGIYFHSILQALPSQKIIEELPELSNRQKEVLKWTLSNKRTKEIADILNLSERTVNLHIGIAMKKLTAKSRYEAALKASKYGLI